MTEDGGDAALRTIGLALVEMTSCVRGQFFITDYADCADYFLGGWDDFGGGGIYSG